MANWKHTFLFFIYPSVRKFGNFTPAALLLTKQALGFTIFPTNSSNGTEERYTYDSIVQSANFLKKITNDLCPTVGIICGSGLGPLADTLKERIEVPYEKIPNFPTSTVQGHSGSLVFGRLEGVPVVCMKGRFHVYEGYPLWKCTMPVRVMKLMGVTHLLVTNAAGGLNDRFNVGDIMLIKDHINFVGFSGNSPLQGPNDDRFGPRFPAMNKAYDRDIMNHAKTVAKDLGIQKNLHEGVYACVGGPTYETVAELRLMKMLGADAVGMSTAHEVVTAKHCDMTVFAFSLITNKSILSYDVEEIPNHDEVIEASRSKEKVLQTFVNRIIAYIDNKQCMT